jgi:hypothetical protein
MPAPELGVPTWRPPLIHAKAGREEVGDWDCRSFARRSAIASDRTQSSPPAHSCASRNPVFPISDGREVKAGRQRVLACAGLGGAESLNSRLRALLSGIRFSACAGLVRGTPRSSWPRLSRPSTSCFLWCEDVDGRNFASLRPAMTIPGLLGDPSDTRKSRTTSNPGQQCACAGLSGWGRYALFR